MALLTHRPKIGCSLLDAHSHNPKRITMTPKDKAKELVDLFTVIGLQQRNEGIQCAISAVDEILDVIKLMPYGMQYLSARDYFEEVKEEIQKL